MPTAKKTQATRKPKSTKAPAKKKTAKKKPKITKSLVGIVLDRSGSMGAIRNEIIGAFNEQIKTLKESKIDTEVSLVTFSTGVDPFTLSRKPIKEVEELTEGNYIPNGLTALNDAIIAMTNDLHFHPDIDKDSTAVLLLVVTDGQENNSMKPTTEVRDVLKALEATGRWTITYMGANFDPMEISRDYGIDKSNIAAFAATADGTRMASSVMSASIDRRNKALENGDEVTLGFYSGD